MDYLNLKILTPSRIILKMRGVKYLRAETPSGICEVVPHGPNSVAALMPGVLTYETWTSERIHVAHDYGVLIKSGYDVLISARDAINGTELDVLKKEVKERFTKPEGIKTSTQSVLIRMKRGFIPGTAEFHRD